MRHRNGQDYSKTATADPAGPGKKGSTSTVAASGENSKRIAVPAAPDPATTPAASAGAATGKATSKTSAKGGKASAAKQGKMPRGEEGFTALQRSWTAFIGRK